jgi:hypothetical protein
VTAGLVILIENRKSIRTTLRDGFILGFASILPIAWWLIVHNIMMYGSLWGLSSQVVEPGRNTSLALTKMMHWFVPYLSFLMPVLTRPLIPLGITALFLFWINRNNKHNGTTWIRSLTAPFVYPTMIYAVVYFFALALTVVTGDHLDLFSDRYYVILLVPTIIFLLLTFDFLIAPHVRLSSQKIGSALILVFALWSLYPLYSFGEYLVESSVQGEPSGANMFNGRRYHEMAVVAEMKRIRAEQPHEIFYSNYVDAVWFFTRRPVSLLPFVVDGDPAESYAGWPHAQAGYIVWFEPNEYKHYLAPKEIAKFANLELIFQGTGGKIYYVRAR